MPTPLVSAAAVRTALRAAADPLRARNVARFFKTAPGEYGDGDRFIGVTVPAQRSVARRCRDLPLEEIDLLLMSPIHEHRLTALLILVDRFTHAGRDSGPPGRANRDGLSRSETRRIRREADRVRGRIYRLYMKRLRFINNWDLVDTSAPPIVGGWLASQSARASGTHRGTKKRVPGELDRLARSPRLWSRRVAMLATLYSIVQGEHRNAIRIATILVHDREDLMHKAVGWMLREVGKRASADALNRFLTRHAATMPRTMLRYAIERLPPAERKRWMSVRSVPATRQGRRMG